MFLGSLGADSFYGQMSEMLVFLMRIVSAGTILVFKPQKLKE